MTILSPINETFDVFIKNMKTASREETAHSLERADDEIYFRIDRKRFRLIRKVTRLNGWKLAFLSKGRKTVNKTVVAP
jgi:hypothetical protein